jgi:vacuolar-type H+-ATPase subunit E/Vma4
VPLDQLLTALERDAREQAERVVAEARAEAARITEAAEQEVARRREATVGAQEREQRAHLEQALSEARRAARRDVLEARDRLLARVFAAARAALPDAVRRPAYTAALPQRVEAALAAFENTEGVVVRAPPALAPALGAAVSGHPGLRVCADATAGSGFRVATADGSLEVDDTLETRLAARRAALARDALRQLGLEP